MYSQCPECHTRFRVTAEVLSAARGTVRCGRCGNAFDALARLSDSVPPARIPTHERPDQAGAAARSSAPPDAAVAAEYHFTADDLEKVFIDAQDWQRQFGPEAAAVPAGEPADEAAETPMVVVDESEPLEDITLEGERISIDAPPGFGNDELASDGHRDRQYDLDSTDEFEVLDAPVPANPPGEDTGKAGESEPGRAAVGAPMLDYLLEPEPEPESVPLAAQHSRRPAETEEEFVITAHHEEVAGREGSGWRTLAWSLGCALLAVGMLAQVTHYYRQELVRRPSIGSALRAVYGHLGLPLSPNWDLAAYGLRQWDNGIEADQDDRMSIRASLTNRAGFAQPHPILRLELEDRFGEPIAVRDFEPAEYLRNQSEASRLMAPAASTEAELLILDPGPDAVGYRLDVCLRESARQLRCTQGPG